MAQINKKKKEKEEKLLLAQLTETSVNRSLVNRGSTVTLLHLYHFSYFLK